MKFLMAILAITLCSGCASTARWVEDNPEEAAWQALHVVDVLQTASGAGDSWCYEEVDKMTRLIIGERPTKDRVYKWGVASAVAHYAVLKAIEGTRFEKPIRVFDMVVKVKVVRGNHSQGVRMHGRNRLANECR